MCYGLDTPLEEEIYGDGDDGIRIKTFHCDRCKEQTNDRDFVIFIIIELSLTISH